MTIEHPSQYLPKELIDKLRAVAPEAEKLGQLHPEQLAIIHDQGWLNMLVAKAYGGLDLSLADVLRTEEALAWTDGSVGWVVTLCSGAGWFAGFLDEALAKEVFSHPQVCIAGSGATTGTATETESGYTITGFWKHASGAHHATAFTANCQIEREGELLLDTKGQPVIRTFLFLKEEVTLHPTWNAMGMMATGSHAFSVTNLHVPPNRCFIITPEQAQLPDAIYQYPFLQLAETTLAVNLSGMAMRFIDLCKEYATAKLERNGRSTSHLLLFTEAAQAQLNTLRQVFYDTVQESCESLLEATSISDSPFSSVSATSKELLFKGRQLVNELYPYCGLQAAATSTEMNRIWRNLHTAGQHALFRSI
ncbi:acyl-CoA dehydrogenase family protein [Flavisolibacter tropicus]|uniref:Acyl-CoA dehydrogenase C-terminal domain-containing protein n=1 Tax=Flavisolibacter tropicus TaxID=1492898 RepID=A0A172TWW5_9BACT|nr:acyl-CoA dehydrogenase family protein [Flavisolibacter tropicus]ANE51496.1 hypothetical protein SY85_14265 [Flavisolibacter tropicus]